MKIVEIPQDGDAQNKRKAVYTRNRKATGTLAFITAILAILCMIGLIVCIVLTELGERSAAEKTLLYILVGSFAGGAVLFAVAAFLLSKLSQTIYLNELDFRERCDGENSFFVGEGTLATFDDGVLRIHAEAGGKADVLVPYSETRYFSVCSRRAPCEKGEWSVVIEVPSKYLSKNGEESETPALIQTDAKDRLYRCLEEKGLTLLGEQRSEGSGKRFTPLKKFNFPDPAARKRALMTLGLGCVLIVAGVLVAVFWQLTAGAILSAFGVFLTVRATFAFLSAKRVLAFYQEGVFWREKNRNDRIFLKWEEIQSITPEEKNGIPLLKAQCAYGAYHFLSADGALECVKEIQPDKAKEE